MLASLLATATAACSKTVSARALNDSRVYPIKWCFYIRRGKCIRSAFFDVVEASAAMLADSGSFQNLDSEWKALEWRLT